jgi:hypothetical protein
MIACLAEAIVCVNSIHCTATSERVSAIESIVTSPLLVFGNQIPRPTQKIETNAYRTHATQRARSGR